MLSAEINELLKKYNNYLAAVTGPGQPLSAATRATLGVTAGANLAQLPSVEEFRADLVKLRKQIYVDFPQAIDRVNAAQGQLLSRINFIYDHSSVPEPLIKQIDLSAYPGNLIVYYTIRRVEGFTRYTIPQIAGPGNPAAPATPPAVPAAGTPLPSSATAAAAPATVAAASPAPVPGTTVTTTTTVTTPAAAASSSPSGIVVSQGQFEVHDFYHATVVGFFAFGYLKDATISAQPNPSQTKPTTCTGAAPDTSCNTPLQANHTFQADVVLGPLYYFSRQGTDTFPNARRNAAQQLGIFGGASVTKLNHYYAGFGWEPKIGVQILAGAHVGSTTVLQNPYIVGTSADVATFPTTSRFRTGFFVGAGFDLTLFRKIFGSVTGVGTATTTPPAATTTTGQ